MNNTALERKQALVEKLLEMGYEPDPRGNMLCTGLQLRPDGTKIRRQYRVKFQDISVRLEIQGLERHPIYNTLPWLRVTSCYYTQIVDCEDGRLRIGSVFVGTQRVLQPA
jgi:hypothetical protein